MKCVIAFRRQGGAVIVTAALLLLFLLGFMGITLDFGHLFVVKTELQTAVDSCALAAAEELKAVSTQADLTRAANAGLIAANLNKVDFQGASAGIADADVTFSDSLVGAFSRTFSPPGSAKYVRCTHTKTGIAPWILKAMTAFTGDASYNASRSVSAVATATLASSQTNCALPVAICRKSATAPYGFNPGDWLLGAVDSQDQVVGQFRWVDYSVSTGAGGVKAIKDNLSGAGQCNLPGNSTEVKSKTGNNSGARAAYNTRFGIYQGSYSSANAIPDLTGYAWYAATAAGAMPGRYLDTGPNGFGAKRTANAAYQGDDKSPNDVGLQTQGTVYGGSLATVGGDRRLVIAPVADCSQLDSSHTIKVDAMVCLLLLHPLPKPGGPGPVNMWLEYVGPADAPATPCATVGLVGGSSGPKVPALVQ